jgi:CheY-like chemotaxis protein
MDDKRAYQRAELSLSGRFKVAELGGDFFETTVVNLGPEGLCFFSGIKIEAGQQIELEVFLSQEKHIQLSTVVVWSDQKNESGFYRVGLKIMKTGNENEKLLLDFYLEKNLQGQKPKKKILVIDDEKDLVDLLSFHLSQAGYEVMMAFDGEEGYQKYEQQAPDLIILDLKMPKLNGFEVCRKIRREKKDLNIPILMLTALQDDADRLIGKVVGAQRYMTKPFKIEELLQEVEWLMPTDLFTGGE